jgi:hypothetical protein
MDRLRLLQIVKKPPPPPTQHEQPPTNKTLFSLSLSDLPFEICNRSVPEQTGTKIKKLISIPNIFYKMIRLKAITDVKKTRER